jgi:hypothetical protein
MSAPSSHAWLLEGVEYQVFTMEECWYLSATGDGQRHGKCVALDAAGVVELMALIDDPTERTKRAKRLLGY